MNHKLLLGIGVVALATPVLYLYLLSAAPGPAAAVLAVTPATPAIIVVAVATFLLGWVTITTLSFPHSPETSSNDGGIPIMRRHVRLRWAESANPAV